MELGEKIKQLRLEKGCSSGQLAKESGVSRAYLWQLETGGKESPSLQILQKLASVLGVSVSELCDADPPKVDFEGLPPGLAEFVKKKGTELRLRPPDVEMMRGIRFRGRQPDNPEDWELLFLFLRKWAG